MDEETLLKEYKKSRQLIEEQEDELKNLRRKSEDLLDSTLNELHYTLTDIADDNEAFNQAKREMEKNCYEFEQQIAKERKTLQRKEEESEANYRSKLKQLNQKQ